MVLMGKVYSSTEILTNAVPEQKHFDAAREAVIGTAEACIERGSVTGLMTYGTVAIGETNLRSDYDGISVCPDEAALHEARAIPLAAYNASEGKVSVNIVPYTRDMLENGEHEIDRFMGVHLTGSERLVVGEDPARYMKFPTTPAQQVADNYLRNKKRRLASAYFDPSMDSTAGIVGIQRMLEAPIAVGRNLAGALDEIEGTHLATDRSANKPLMRKIALRVFRELGESDEAEWLLAADEQYTRHLELTVSGAMQLREYEAALHGLFELANCAGMAQSGR